MTLYQRKNHETSRRSLCSGSRSSREIYKTLIWVEDTDMQQVIIEGDSELVVHALHGRETYQVGISHILKRK